MKRALTLESIPQAKANEMAIEKTVELCRSNARSDLVKGILASTRFDDPKEVIAKYIVESRTETTEKQVLHFRKQNVRQNRGNGYRNQRSGNFNNQNNNGYQNNGYQNNGRGNYRGNQRGRGRGRGNYYQNNQNRGYQNNGNRIYFAENQMAPPPGANPQNVVQLNQADPNQR